MNQLHNVISEQYLTKHFHLTQLYLKDNIPSIDTDMTLPITKQTYNALTCIFSVNHRCMLQETQCATSTESGK